WEQHLGRECALIEYSGKMTSKPEQTSILNDAEISYDEKGISGFIWFDPAICMTVESTIEIPVTLKLHTRLPEQHTRSITMKIKQDTTTKLIE
ncbi:MAG: hypothetical protein N2246_03165, partial [Candidatus Sumerlaeia bacterium]|nr:hypothetical protein [Candidatus Sumerlaeia bacterium]